MQSLGKIQIEYRKIDELEYYPGNPRIMSEETLEKLRRSIREFGLVCPLVINKKNQVIGGNQRLKALRLEGVKEVPVIVVDLPEKKEKALNIALNKIIGDWDTEKLKAILDEIMMEDSIDIDITGFDEEEIKSLYEEIEEGIEKEKEVYTRKVEPPIYQITGEKPLLGELYNDTKYIELSEKIEKLKIDEDLKYFLKLAATRFIEFRYDKIAEFYAHSEREVQEIMEELALVIIDFNKAIELGFVKLVKDLMEEYAKEYEE